jgi:Recombination endonuclease VII
MLPIISRQAATAINQNWYFTGKPCKRRHVAKRGVIGRGCYKCVVMHVRKYVKKNRTKKAVWDKTYYDKNPERARKLSQIRGWRRDGLPIPTRPAPKYCEACGCLPSKQLHLDHCHVTGKFRGWLCNRCNLGLGHLGDNEIGLLRMLEYVRRAS